MRSSNVSYYPCQQPGADSLAHDIRSHEQRFDMAGPLYRRKSQEPAIAVHGTIIIGAGDPVREGLAVIGKSGPGQDLLLRIVFAARKSDRGAINIRQYAWIRIIESADRISHCCMYHAGTVGRVFNTNFRLFILDQ